MTADSEALAALISDWSRFYVVSYDGILWHATRRDDGAKVHEADPAQLRAELEADYRARPFRAP